MAAGYGIVNVMFGNVLEPKLVGGWVWEPVGMLLSVPVIMVVKIARASSF